MGFGGKGGGTAPGLARARNVNIKAGSVAFVGQLSIPLLFLHQPALEKEQGSSP